MLIPLIAKDPEANDFTCRDGEIEYMAPAGTGGTEGGDTGSGDSAAAAAAYGLRFSLTPEGTCPAFTVRIPLQSGDAEKARLLLGGEPSRVDAATADRLTAAILQKTAAEFSQVVAERRRLGLHLLPFRAYCMLRSADGRRGFPSAQAVMLPSESPPHPEITGSGISDDTLTLSMRIPVTPSRLEAVLPVGSGACDVQTFVSYPVYIPLADEAAGSIGSVKSMSGGNATGVRFAFLSEGSMKASVAASEKYYRLYGNPQTGYRLASKAAPAADYSVYAELYGAAPLFPVDSLTAMESSADPFAWIADWEKIEDGCLPISLPYACRGAVVGGGDDVGGGGDGTTPAIPEYADAGLASKIMAATGWKNVLLTRPMTFAGAERSRRNAAAQSVRTLRVIGLPDSDALGVLLGSDDGRRYEALRIFDPHGSRMLLTPPRLFHRLLLAGAAPFGALAIQINE